LIDLKTDINYWPNLCDIFKTKNLANYDINNHSHLEIIHNLFDMITADEWDEYAEIAEERNMSYKAINVLRSAAKRAGMSKYMSAKVMVWVLALVDELDEDLPENEDEKPA